MPNIIDTSKAVMDLAKRGLTIELQEKLMDLREEALALQEDNLALKKEIAELKKAAELKETVTFKKGLYYKDGDSTPFCPHCFESTNKLFHLKIHSSSSSNSVYADCCSCLICYRSDAGSDFCFNHKHK